MRSVGRSILAAFDGPINQLYTRFQQNPPTFLYLCLPIFGETTLRQLHAGAKSGKIPTQMIAARDVLNGIVAIHR